MPIWSRKGKERASCQSKDVDLARDSNLKHADRSSGLHEMQDGGRSISDSLDGQTLEQVSLLLSGYWSEQASTFRDKHRSIGRRCGPCSLAGLANEEAENEATNMCIELRDYSKDLGPRLLSKEQIKQVIQSFQTSYTYEVPSKITSVALESVIRKHGNCCCRDLLQDPKLAWYLHKSRSFQGNDPLPICSVGPPSAAKSKQEEVSEEERRDAGAPEDEEAPPSYKEAIS